VADKYIDVLVAQDRLHRGDILKIGTEYMEVFIPDTSLLTGVARS